MSTYYVDGSRTGTGVGSQADPFKTLGEAADAIAVRDPGNHIAHVRAKDNSGQDIIYNTQHGVTGKILSVPYGDEENYTYNFWLAYASTPGDLAGIAVLDCQPLSLAGLHVGRFNCLVGFDVRKASGIGITSYGYNWLYRCHAKEPGGSGILLANDSYVYGCKVNTPGGSSGILGSGMAVEIDQCMVIPGPNTTKGICVLNSSDAKVSSSFVGPLVKVGTVVSPIYGIRAVHVTRCSVIASVNLGEYSFGITADDILRKATGNLVVNFGTGIVAPVQSLPNIAPVAYNAILGCTTPISGDQQIRHDNVTSGSPVFVDAANGDFRQLPTSAGFSVGADFRLVAGAMGAAVSDVPPAGPGGIRGLLDLRMG